MPTCQFIHLAALNWAAHALSTHSSLLENTSSGALWSQTALTGALDPGDSATSHHQGTTVSDRCKGGREDGRTSDRLTKDHSSFWKQHTQSPLGQVSDSTPTRTSNYFSTTLTLQPTRLHRISVLTLHRMISKQLAESWQPLIMTCNLECVGEGEEGNGQKSICSTRGSNSNCF